LGPPTDLFPRGKTSASSVEPPGGLRQISHALGGVTLLWRTTLKILILWLVPLLLVAFSDKMECERTEPRGEIRVVVRWQPDINVLGHNEPQGLFDYALDKNDLPLGLAAYHGNGCRGEVLKRRAVDIAKPPSPVTRAMAPTPVACGGVVRRPGPWGSTIDGE
jgi:hypothetical protein